MIPFKEFVTLFLIFCGCNISDVASQIIKIYPTTRDTIVTLPRDLSLGCEGDGLLENVTWVVPDNSEFWTNTDFDRRVLNKKKEKEMLPKFKTRSPDNINITYMNITDIDDESKINVAALLVLKNVNYADVGSYVCHVVGAPIDDDEKSKPIFVFVKDLSESRLAFLEKDKYYTINHRKTIQNITFPCIPVAPNTTVILKATSSTSNTKSYTEISSEIATYNNKIGYTLKISETNFDTFICEFRGNKTNEEVYFTIQNNFFDYNIKPYIDSSDVMYKYSNFDELKLNCTIAIDRTDDYKNTSALNWIIPNEELKVEDITTRNTVPMYNGDLHIITLHIKNLTEKDTGEYICKLNNTENNDSEAKKFVAVDIFVDSDIKPVINVSKNYIVIKPGQDLILSCHDNKKLNWSLPYTQQNSSIYLSDIKDPSDKLAQNYTHVKYLRISNVSYYHTGKYYCHKENLRKNDPFFSNEIFVYVEDEKHLTSYPDKLINIVAAEYSNVTIPCIPTSPKVKVSLIDTSTSKKRPEKFDPFEGFTLYLPVDDIIDNLECKFEKGNQSETIKIHIDVQRSYKYVFMPYLSTPSKTFSFIGGDLVLYCSVIVKQNFFPKISWATPKQPEFLKNRTLNESINNYMFSNGKLVVSTITISNVGLRDNREYQCSIQDDRNNTRYDRQLLSLNITFDIQPVIKTKPAIAKGETLVATCNVRADHNIRFNITWDFPAGLKDNRSTITESEYFTDVFGRLGNNTLIIKNVTWDDIGNYTCKVRDHQNHTNEQTVNIDIRDPVYPKIYESTIENITKIVKIGDSFLMRCFIGKNDIPEPNITWYKNNKVINNGDQEITITFNARNDSGIYSCNVTNTLGMTSYWASIEIEEEETNILFKIFGGILAVLIVGFIILMFIFGRRWKREREYQRQLDSIGLVDITKGQISNLNPNISISDQAELLPYDIKWEIPRDRIKIGEQLGSGEFGIVMKGEVFCVFVGETIKKVAIKKLRRNPDHHSMKALVNELKIMTYIGKHVNVVNLLGACTTNIKKREIFIVIEYCIHGSVQNYMRDHRDVFINQIDPETGLIDIDNIDPELYKQVIPSAEELAKCMNPYINLDKNPEKQKKICKADYKKSKKYVNEKKEYENVVKEEKQKYLSTHDLICWSFQVARAMEYLSSRRILHGDLAARNVLLSDSNIVKICDFGLSKNMYKYKNYKKKSKTPLPVKWMAIESIRDRIFSVESDVWSFGVTLWEFFTLARTPYSEMEADAQFVKELENGLRMDQPEYATSDIYHIMKNCWEENPTDRPTFSTLVELLGSLVHANVRKHYLELNKPYENLNIIEKSPDYISKKDIESTEAEITDPKTDEICNEEKIEENEKEKIEENEKQKIEENEKENNESTVKESHEISDEESGEDNESSELEDSEMIKKAPDSQIRKRFTSIADVEVHHPLA